MKAVLLIKIAFEIRDRAGNRRADVEDVLQRPVVFKRISVPTLEHLKPGETILEWGEEMLAVITEIISVFDGEVLAPMIRAELTLPSEEFAELTGFNLKWLENGGFEALLLFQKRTELLKEAFAIGISEALARSEERLEGVAKKFISDDGFKDFIESEERMDLSEKK